MNWTHVGWTAAQILFWTGAGFGLNWIFERFPCSCGRAHPPYFFREHNRVWTMVFWASFWTLLVLINILTAVVHPSASSYIIAVTFSLICLYYWRMVWFHEKDKIKRAAKALGRVVINEHGRLKVATGGSSHG